MSKKDWIPIGIGIVALMIGAVYDYEITHFLYQKLPLLSMFYEQFLLLPIQFMIVIAMSMQARIKKQLAYLLIGYVACLYMIYDGLHYWMQIQNNTLVLMAIFALLLTLLTFLIVCKLPYAMVEKRRRFFLFFALVLITSIAITSVWKSVWGRIRYREMQEISQFCVWYKPCFMSGHHSFPSGHTTAFTTILCFLKWKDTTSQKTSMFRYITISVLLLSMPIMRMIAGAHFLSDTAMGFIITYACYLFYRNKFMLRGGYL